MGATITITRNKTLPNSSEKADFHDLVDTATATITNIANSDIANDAAIADSKLAQISTASKVDTDALTTTSEAQGDVMYHNGTKWTRLGAGTDGQFLKTQGAAANPVWADAVAQANQAALEAETDENTYVPPDLVRYHPGVCKAWVYATDTGTPAIVASYNMTSFTGGGSGAYTCTFDDDFSSAAYAVAGWCKLASSGGVVTGQAALAAGSLAIHTRTTSNSASDMELISVVFFGDQGA